MSKMVLTESECDRIKALAIRLINSNVQFPTPMFKPNQFKFITLESWSIFDEEAYSAFQDFMTFSGDNEFFIVPDDILEIDSSNYEEKINTSKLREFDTWPILKISSKLAYTNYAHVRDDFLTWSRETYLFGDSLKWLIFNNADYGIMLFGYDLKLQSVMNRIYGVHEDRITDFDTLFDLMEIDPNDVKKKSIKELLLKEYSESLKDAPPAAPNM